ncbi:SDR family oxidoreductase [Stenotrophomonas rhizophila]|nr:SDR family oxidoreductase [Stenotrophomonas rhizophila]UQY87895.1 SDR family oxidoreductase [Stenotrophomonas rhizophila]
MGAAEERASAAIFLASSESSFVNGAELRVDGGSTCLGAAVAETWSIGRHLPCRMGGHRPSLADGGSLGAIPVHGAPRIGRVGASHERKNRRMPGVISLRASR